MTTPRTTRPKRAAPRRPIRFDVRPDQYTELLRRQAAHDGHISIAMLARNIFAGAFADATAAAAYVQRHAAKCRREAERSDPTGGTMRAAHLMESLASDLAAGLHLGDPNEGAGE